jgi:hypothetical protein
MGQLGKTDALFPFSMLMLMCILYQKMGKNYSVLYSTILWLLVVEEQSF